MQHIKDPFHARDWFFLVLVVILAFGMARMYEKYGINHSFDEHLEQVSALHLALAKENNQMLKQLLKNQCKP